MSIFPEVIIPPVPVYNQSEMDATIKRINDAWEAKKELVKKHISQIRAIESSWDDITLSRIRKSLGDEVAFAWWDIVCTNRKILKQF